MPSYPETPGHKVLGPSADAAKKAAGKAELLRNEVLRVLVTEDLTADEAAAKLGQHFINVRPRCSELLAAGKIADTKQRRPSALGSPATVWRAL